MEKLYLDKNNKSIEIAEIANINSKEQLVYGNYDRDLILRAKGGITIQIQNKFYKVPLQEIRTDSSTDESMMGFIPNIKDAVGIFPNGYLMFETSTNKLYFYYNNTPYLVTGSGGSNEGGGGSNPQPAVGNFISYEEVQLLSSIQRQTAVNNLGLSVTDYSLLASINPFENEFIFVSSNNAHYVLRNGYWRELYLNAIRGGIVHGKTGIVNSSTPIDKSLKGLLHILTDNQTFFTEDQNDLNGIYIGETNGLKIYGLDYTSVIQGSSEKLLKITTDLSTDNIVIYRDKTSFNTVDTVPYAAINVDKGIAIDNAYIKNSITSEGGMPGSDLDYNAAQGFTLYKNDNIGWIFRVTRMLVEDVASDYKLKSVTQTYISDSFLLTGHDIDDGDIIATFRNTNNLNPGDLLLGVTYNKTKAVASIVKVKIIEIRSSVRAKIDIVTDHRGFLDLELIRVGNDLNEIFITLMDKGTESLRTVKGITSFSELNLPTTFLEDNQVEDQNTIPDIPLYNLPKFLNTVNAIGNLNNITDVDLNPNGYGIYSNNAFIKGEADLSYLKLGDQLLFDNGALTINSLLVEGYKNYGLGVITAVPHELTNASGMYGMFTTSPLSGQRGSVLRMQSESSAHQSELWISGVTTNTPKIFIRSNAGITVGDWSKVYTDSDISSQDITNWDLAFTNNHTHTNKVVLDGLTSTLVTDWNSAFSWGNHADLYPLRAALSPDGVNSMRSFDSRAVNSLPTTHIKSGMTLDFKQSTTIEFNVIPGTSTFASALTVAPYADDAGNNNAAFQLAQSAGILGYRNYTTGVWTTWKRLLTSAEYDSTNFVTTDTEQNITAIKTFAGPVDFKLGQANATNTLHRIENAATIVSDDVAVQTSILIKINATLAAIMTDIELDILAYSGVSSDTNTGKSGKIKITYYNASETSNPVSCSASVLYGKRDLLSKVEYYKDASNFIYIRLTGNFGGYAKTSATLTLHHTTTDESVKTIAKGMTVEYSADITDLTLTRTLDTDAISQFIDTYNLGENAIPTDSTKGGIANTYTGDVDLLPKTTFVTTVSNSDIINKPEFINQPSGLISVHSGDVGMQIIGDRAGAEMGFRSQAISTYGTWRRLWHDGNLTTAQITDWDNAVTYSSVGHLPLSGGTLTGKLVTFTADTTNASLNIPHGIEPTSPINGDVWTTTDGIKIQINGVINQLASTTQWSALTLLEAETGTDTNDKLITASVLKSAIKFHTNNLITDTTDITNITTATYTDDRATVTLINSYPGNIYDDDTVYTYIVVAPNKIRRF